MKGELGGSDVESTATFPISINFGQTLWKGLFNVLSDSIIHTYFQALKAKDEMKVCISLVY